MNDSPVPPSTAEDPAGATAEPAGAGSTALSTGIIALGIALFVIGLASIIISFAAPAFDTHLSDYFYLAAMLCPLGMIVGVVGALFSGRRRR